MPALASSAATIARVLPPVDKRIRSLAADGGAEQLAWLVAHQPDWSVVGGHPGRRSALQREHARLGVDLRRTLSAQQDLRAIVASWRIDLVTQQVAVEVQHRHG